jgi:hypothetical protein
MLSSQTSFLKIHGFDSRRKLPERLSIKSSNVGLASACHAVALAKGGASHHKAATEGCPTSGHSSLSYFYGLFFEYRISNKEY